MSQGTSSEETNTMSRSAMDALLYGIFRGLEYLGEDRQPILDDMGDHMLAYLMEVGAVAAPEDRTEFVRSLRDLLVKSGFGPDVTVEFKGNPPAPSVPNFLYYLKPDEMVPAGLERTALSKGNPRSGTKVDWVVYEMALYGMTKALDPLGAQAQIILNEIGNEMTNYLVETGEIEPSGDPFKFYQRLTDYFIKAGYAKSLDLKLEGNPPTMAFSTWKSAPFYSTVFKRLQKEGSSLFSCPMCIAGVSIMERANGIKFQFAVEYHFLPNDEFYMTSKLIQPTETFTEEDAKKISEATA